ncbi:hypothetical protein MtrunA17_Chr5g0396891 [Medicago truncatula]|uniref:Uncharacterized protein n=1 Tax=Medicago truncatula TaxID=3880 RepID=A0A396HS30_MEDTR|nr:hypothetical protein MtrunA17_Chr5g0396891 [Medicago truncatula]
MTAQTFAFNSIQMQILNIHITQKMYAMNLTVFDNVGIYSCAPVKSLSSIFP